MILSKTGVRIAKVDMRFHIIGPKRMMNSMIASARDLSEPDKFLVDIKTEHFEIG